LNAALTLGLDTGRSFLVDPHRELLRNV
jgi:hypothetical protein